jgi:thiamine-phosphate pyrophosphorylase
MFRYAITSRTLFPGNSDQQQAALLQQAARWAADGIDIIQLREKDLPAATLAHLARQILETIRQASGPNRGPNASPTKLLINSRPDVALATAAHGVHLTSSTNQLTPTQVRQLYAEAHLPPPVVTVSCHTQPDIDQARNHQADAILYAPIFEKTIANQPISPGQGLDRLRAACKSATPIPIYALGGVTLENAPLCLQAGAAGIAGIRLFTTHKPPAQSPLSAVIP